jgi:hypothetical protein
MSVEYSRIDTQLEGQRLSPAPPPLAFSAETREDELSAARGIVFGVLISVLGCAAFGALLWLLLR